jgi:hypothetical protein
MSEATTRPSFQAMVANLFKKMPGHGAPMMHAAIGIAGESGELREVTDRKNFFEEAGDTEFYIEAAWQSITQGDRLTYTAAFVQNILPTVQTVTLGDVLDDIHVISCHILDAAKKVWVHEDGNRDHIIAPRLCQLEYRMRKAYELMGINRQDVLDANQDKLLGTKDQPGRYESGTYSDAQALARADKVRGATREFIGKDQK